MSEKMKGKYMVAPDYTTNYSLMQDRVHICGNVQLAEALKHMLKENCINHMDLYEAQEFIKNHCVDRYGADFYERSAEAIMFIVENEYCNVERANLPFVDTRFYEKYIKDCVTIW